MNMNTVAKQIFVFIHANEPFLSALSQILLCLLVIISAIILYLIGLVIVSFIKSFFCPIPKQTTCERPVEIILMNGQAKKMMPGCNHYISATNDELFDYLWKFHSSDLIGLYKFFKKPEQPDYEKNSSSPTAREEMLLTVYDHFKTN